MGIETDNLLRSGANNKGTVGFSNYIARRRNKQLSRDRVIRILTSRTLEFGSDSCFSIEQ